MIQLQQYNIMSTLSLYQQCITRASA